MTQTQARPWFVPDPEEIRERERILASTYYLVRQDGELGEKMRCKRCNAKHPYFTLMCIEQPFCGLDQGLYAFWRHSGMHGSEQYLSEAGKARYQALAAAFTHQPDLAESHPITAASLHVPPRDIDFGALALGTLEPITRQKAQQLVWRINTRGCRPPLRLPGIKGGF